MPQRDRLWDVARLVMTVAVLGLAAYAVYLGQDFRPLAAYFPMAAAYMILAFAGVQLVIDVVNFARKRPIVMSGVDVDSPIHGTELAGLLRALRYVGWFVGYIALLWVFGVLVSGPLFVLAFLKLEGRWGWIGAGVLAAGVLAMSYVLVSGFGLQVPRTLLDIGHDLL